MASKLLSIVNNTKYENELTKYRLTPEEEEWFFGAVNHHSYFEVELFIDNKIRNVYFMDASNAEAVTDLDKKNYNFERRVYDEGVIKKKLNKKRYKAFKEKYLILSLNGEEGIEYVQGEKFDKLYRCRPFGWAIEAFKADNYGK